MRINCVIICAKPAVKWETLDARSKTNVFWLTHLHHGIEWNEGYVDYNEMKTHLRQLLKITNIPLPTIPPPVLEADLKRLAERSPSK